MATHSFALWLDTTATMKRTPTKAGGKVGAAVSNGSVTVVPLMPTDPKLRDLFKIDAARRSWMTFSELSADIIAGDLMTVSGTEYSVLFVGPWPTDQSFNEIVLLE